MKKIGYEEFLDKVHGCWFGKCLGGAAGASNEGVKKIIPIDDFTEVCSPELPNDDLDIQLLWLFVLEEKGADITSDDLAKAFVERCWYPFSEYGYFMKNYMRGVKPPYTGIINNGFYKNGMGCAIRSEIWAVIAAGNPDVAVKYAYIDGCIDHADEAVNAERFLAAIESQAFFKSDIRELISDGLKYAPEDSKLSKCIRFVLKSYEEGKEWIAVRRAVLAKFGHEDFTNVVQNLAFITIALLYGNCDMRSVLNIALKCGYDTDCTCASAASVVGILKGYSALGEVTKAVNGRFVCGINANRPSGEIFDLAKDVAEFAVGVTNEEVEFVNAPSVEKRGKLVTEPEYATEEGLKAEIAKLKPIPWKIYGPYFQQLDLPMNPNFPSPHPEGSPLPDLVCMVNNEVFLDKEYEKGDEYEKIEAYDDFIDADSVITMEGQYCCFAETTVVCPDDRKVWFVVGNNDGFSIKINGKEVLKMDEIRLWTPQNNFCLAELKKGKNKIEIKLLRRTDKLKFAVGIRNYDGCHWHQSKWSTDISYE